MSRRLVDIYRPGDRVEIHMVNEITDEWRPGRVRGLQHPGVWVQTEDGSMWFVTNGRRIRPLSPDPR